MAGLLARPRLGALSHPRPRAAEPRQERPFGRPFPCLVAQGGVLLPVRITEGEDPAEEPAVVREALAADAQALKN